MFFNPAQCWVTQEEGILKQLSAVWKALDRWKSQGSTEMQQEWKALADGASGLKCNGWISLETEGKLLKQDQPLRDVHDLTWPGADDEAVKPLKRGSVLYTSLRSDNHSSERSQK